MSSGPARYPREPNVQARILEYFERRAGATVYVSELESHLKCRREVVQKGVLNLQKRDGWAGRLVTMVRGQAWVLSARPRTKAAVSAAVVVEPTGRIYEELMAGTDGGVLLVCEDGDLYLAHKVKLPVRETG